MSQQHLPWTYSKQLTFAVFLFMPAGRNILLTDIRLITNHAGCGVGGYKVYTVAFFWGTVSIVYMLWWPCLANIFGWILNPPRWVAPCHQGLDQRSASLSEDFILREVLPRFGHGIDSLYSRTDVETLGKIVWVWLCDRNQNIILFVGTWGEASSDRWKHFSLASWHNTQNLQVLQLRGPSAPIGVLNDAWKWCWFAVVHWYICDVLLWFCYVLWTEVAGSSLWCESCSFHSGSPCAFCPVGSGARYPDLDTKSRAGIGRQARQRFRINDRQCTIPPLAFLGRFFSPEMLLRLLAALTFDIFFCLTDYLHH